MCSGPQTALGGHNWRCVIVLPCVIALPKGRHSSNLLTREYQKWHKSEGEGVERCMVKNPGCSRRRLGFDSHNPKGCRQCSVTHFLGDPMPSSGLWGIRHECDKQGYVEARTQKETLKKKKQNGKEKRKATCAGTSEQSVPLEGRGKRIAATFGHPCLNS